MSKEILLIASELRGKYKFSFWDSTIVASAVFFNCDILYSEDMQSGQKVNGKLIIKNPFL